MTALHHELTGAGEETVLLLHAFGLSGQIWKPVVDELATDMRVLVVDLPAHGRSSLPSTGTPLSPAGYAQVICGLLDELGIDRIHIAGNSIGGWTALELALLGRAKSVTALSPAGLWLGDEPLVRKIRFVVENLGAKVTMPLLRQILRTRRGRELVLGEAMARPGDLTPEQAAAVVADYAAVRNMVGHARGRQQSNSHFSGGESLTVPITVAWGSEDRFIPPNARNRKHLPAHTQWIDLPGCGHVMMYDAPELVAQTIRTTITNA